MEQGSPAILKPFVTGAERHRSSRIGWLRAAVLGANDGIISTASLIIGVASAEASHSAILATAVAGLVSGAMSMAAGEYVSVHSQQDTERADLALESSELANSPEAELRELELIYVSRGLDQPLARQVAIQLTSRDAIGAHTRDELGMTTAMAANPLQAAMASAACFALGASVPLAVTFFNPFPSLITVVGSTGLLCLAMTGAIAAKVGGSSVVSGASRVMFWGALAMLVTFFVGALFGATI